MFAGNSVNLLLSISYTAAAAPGGGSTPEKLFPLA
jgi:hypothetical protein